MYKTRSAPLRCDVCAERGLERTYALLISSSTRRSPARYFANTDSYQFWFSKVNAVSVEPGLVRTHACQSLSRVCSGRGFGRPPPARRAGLSGAPERAATRPGPRRRRFGAGNAPPMAKNHRNRKEGGLRPPRPSGKRLVPKPPFRPRRTATRESLRCSSDFGDFLPQAALSAVKPGLT